MTAIPRLYRSAGLFCCVAIVLAQDARQVAHLRLLDFDAIGKDTLWVWGTDQGSPFVLRSTDGGVRWHVCSLPPAASREIEARTMVPGGFAGFEVHATSGVAASIDWRASDKEGDVTGIGSAKTADGCEHWAVIAGTIALPPGRSYSDLQIRPDNFRVQWLPGHEYGWALLTGNCCGSGQQQTAMVRTRDGGRTWHPIEGEPARRNIPQWENEGFEIRSLDDGWFASAAWGQARPGLWRLRDGGERWVDVGRTLPVPSELRDNVNVTGATAPVFSKVRPRDGAFTAQFEYLVDGGNSPSGHAEVRYETNDDGTTWRVAETNLHSDRPPDVISLGNHGGTVGFRLTRDNAGAVDGMIYARDNVRSQHSQFAFSVYEVVVPTGQMDLSLIYGLRKEENQDIGRIFRSTDQGRTWKPLKLPDIKPATR
jgi:hypothetical protein